MTKKKLMLVMAHPDDAEFSAGGLMTLWHKAGHRIKILCLTNGNAGHHTLGRRRACCSTIGRSTTGSRLGRCRSGDLAGGRWSPYAINRTERETHRRNTRFCTESYRDPSHGGLSPRSSRHRAAGKRQCLLAAGSGCCAGPCCAVTDAEHLADLR